MLNLKTNSLTKTLAIHCPIKRHSYVQKIIELAIVISIMIGIALEVNASPIKGYSQIEEQLKSGELQKANQETLKAILSMEQAAAKTGKFPCDDLRTLEQLWQQYTQGIYGFKAQAQIWQKIKQEYSQQQQYWIGDLVNPFCQELGWSSCELVYGEIKFELSSQKGYLPTTVLSLADNGYNNQQGWKSNQETPDSDDWLFLGVNPGMVESLADTIDYFFTQVRECQL